MFQEKALSRRKYESIITYEFTLDELDTAIRTAADVDKALNVVIKMEK